jgi:hypothetical protein
LLSFARGDDRRRAISLTVIRADPAEADLLREMPFDGVTG